MKYSTHFISINWGTTNFRLRVIQTDTLDIVDETTTDQGIRTLYEKYLDQQQVDQQAYFGKYLKTQIQRLPTRHQGHLIILSGMASSNIGYRELPYADLPLEESGRNLVWEKMKFSENQDLLLISGVKSTTGIMRGEEIQATGLADQLSMHGNGILVLPGTHCKHITYQKGQFTDLKTFMTGELFEVLSTKSILANSVAKGPWSSIIKDAFVKGVFLGFKEHLSENLFSIRAREVLKEVNRSENYYYLSGLLIGDELSYLSDHKEKVFLASAEPLFSMYQLALNKILVNHQLILFNEEDLKQAFLRGQKKILELHG